MTDEQKKLFRQACREAIAEVYETTLQLKAIFDEGQEPLQAAQDKSVIATIGFAGSIEGSLVMIVSDRMACGLVSSMLGMEIEVVDLEVLDGVGEILNMIAGVTKRKGALAASGFEICIPSVISGEKQMCVATLKHTELTTIKVGSNKGSALFLLTLAAIGHERRIPGAQRKDHEAAQSLQDLVNDKEV
ncbi:MAG: chemotaxis protein CheX [Candidatus Omnitrophota bacterium]